MDGWMDGWMDGPPALLQPTLQGFAEAFIARLAHLEIRAVHDLSIRERAGRLAIELMALGSTVLSVQACRLRLHPATTACSRSFAAGLSATQCRRRFRHPTARRHPPRRARRGRAPFARQSPVSNLPLHNRCG